MLAYEWTCTEPPGDFVSRYLTPKLQKKAESRFFNFPPPPPQLSLLFFTAELTINLQSLQHTQGNEGQAQRCGTFEKCSQWWRIKSSAAITLLKAGSQLGGSELPRTWAELPKFGTDIEHSLPREISSLWPNCSRSLLLANTFPRILGRV